MFFCTERYLVFFLAVLAAYWSLPWHRARVWLLLAASFYFYASWNRWLALVVAGSSAADFLLARVMDGTARRGLRRLCLATSVCGNLGLLCYFKYANFFLDSLREALAAAGAQASFPVLQVVLPIGISFYTFEAISYSVDVYRRRLPAERSLPNFLLFITFFPHLVAGPIVRSRDFLPQARRPKRWSWPRCQLGLQLIALGVFKKLAVADRMAQFADPVFADPQAFGTAAAWLAVLAYSVQIYCDFSGYSDLALGSAHLLGYKLTVNFTLPYLAANVSEFWRRWHISLSSWLRDYVFIPLGGSRGGGWRTARNLMATMLLGGLWHGAAWTFVAWGALHGAFLVAHRGFRRLHGLLPAPGGAAARWAGHATGVVLTFACVTLAWVFFRAPSFAVAGGVLRRLLVPCDGRPAPLPGKVLLVLGAAAVACQVLALRGVWRGVQVRLPAPAVGVASAGVLAVALLLAPDAAEKIFIYFQF